jgi:hypothetical protein
VLVVGGVGGVRRPWVLLVTAVGVGGWGWYQPNHTRVPDTPANRHPSHLPPPYVGWGKLPIAF